MGFLPYCLPGCRTHKVGFIPFFSDRLLDDAGQLRLVGIRWVCCRPCSPLDRWAGWVYICFLGPVSGGCQRVVRWVTCIMVLRAGPLVLPPYLASRYPTLDRSLLGRCSHQRRRWKQDKATDAKRLKYALDGVSFSTPVFNPSLVMMYPLNG